MSRKVTIGIFFKTGINSPGTLNFAYGAGKRFQDAAREVTFSTDGFAPLQVFFILIELITVNNNLLGAFIKYQAKSTDCSRKSLWTQIKPLL
jgi:hypothetical protein